MKTPSWFDPRAGLIGALLMGSLAALVNASHGAYPAVVSAAKQAVYTFFFGGLIVQLCSRLASRAGARKPVLTAAIGVPTFITIALISIVHGLRGTPEPLLTIGVVATVGFPSFVMIAIRRRDEVESAAEPAVLEPVPASSDDSARRSGI